MANLFDANWLRQTRDRAVQAPSRPRVPLCAGTAVIGSVEPGFFHQPALAHLQRGVQPLLCEVRETPGSSPRWCLQGDVSQGLHQVALALRDAGLAGAWRHEQLAVCDALGAVLGTVERAAVRPLGIATQAVHLVGQTPDGRHWVQQRALDKDTDPGLWDTLMGGMVPASDNVEAALARETWEEAGLHVSDLQPLRYGGRIATARPSRDGAGTGYLRENLDWYHCTVPEGLVPQNQDGEVAQFRLMDSQGLRQALQRDAFTLEAALIYIALLGAA